MTKGIFVHRTDSIYDDSPAEQYQFPRQYLTRVSACIGDWIIYYEPSKIRDTRGYFAVAKVAHVVPDPTARDMYLALIEPGTYLHFPNPVPFNGPLGLVERGVLNEQGKISGRAQSAVRPLSIEDFNRIIDLGLAEDDSFLPRIDETPENLLREERSPFQFEIERDRVANLGSRLVRDRLFRRRVVEAYDARCAVTGLKLINGGGRAEVEAAHIRPVDRGGPDIVTNGIALSGTVHWMFDSQAWQRHPKVGLSASQPRCQSCVCLRQANLAGCGRPCSNRNWARTVLVGLAASVTTSNMRFSCLA